MSLLWRIPCDSDKHLAWMAELAKVVASPIMC
jgi:hypothetical protein